MHCMSNVSISLNAETRQKRFFFALWVAIAAEGFRLNLSKSPSADLSLWWINKLRYIKAELVHTPLHPDLLSGSNSFSFRTTLSRRASSKQTDQTVNTKFPNGKSAQSTYSYSVYINLYKIRITYESRSVWDISCGLPSKCFQAFRSFLRTVIGLSQTNSARVTDPLSIPLVGYNPHLALIPWWS